MKPRKTFTTLVLLLVFAIATLYQNCGKIKMSDDDILAQMIEDEDTSDDPTPTPVPTSPTGCSKQALGDSITAKLAAWSGTDVDFSFYVESESGESLSYNKGSSTLSTSYHSASSAKWVSASILMRQEEKGHLTLASKPQDLLTSWSIGSDEDLANINLEHLLSFTSGLTEEPYCLFAAAPDFESCVDTISSKNSGNGKIPGEEFYYSGSHLQTAAMMAIKARADITDWQQIFSEFQTETGLFQNSVYDAPSSTNPIIAGGMHWTGNDYIAFLKAFRDASVVSPATKAQMISDHTASTSMEYSPALLGIGQDWHYGFGLWLECPSASFNCSTIEYISSPGKYGAYPFMNLEKNFIGILALEDHETAGFRNGFSIFDSVRDEVEQWDECDNP